MRRTFSTALIAFTFLVSPSLWGKSGPSDSTKSVLPDAPLPATSAPPTMGRWAAPLQAKTPIAKPVLYAPLYARTIFPGELARHLTGRQKFIYAGRQMVEPVDVLPALLSSSWSQYRNSDPLYGETLGAFGQRFGATMLRENSDRLFTDAVLPALLHEDVRYYRLGESSSNVRRTAYALGQVFVTRTDRGRVVPNYSGLIGRAMAIGLTFAYYPPPSRTAGVALSGFGTSVAGLAIYDLLREFVPRDVFSRLTIFRQPDVSPEPTRH